MSLLDALRDRYHVLQGVKAELLDQKIAGRNVMTRPDDVWLVSYPKSGNTWTRFLLANIVYANTNVGFDNIENLVPDIYQHSNYYLQSLQGTRYLKSHEYFDPRYKKVILIVRDPRDVAVSYYHHMIKFGVWNEKNTISDFVGQFIQGSCDPFGSWGENVGSWLGSRCTGHDVLLLRYEDMLENTPHAIGEIARFLGFTISLSAANKITKNCSVKAMQALEKNQGSQWKPLVNSNKDKMFVRSGISGGWKGELQDKVASQISLVWAEQMIQLGYSELN